MTLRNNRLMAIVGTGVALEEDVQDGKLFREREKVFYVRVTDTDQLSGAASRDSQEQWTVKIPKTEGNAAKGNIRVRKVVGGNDGAEPQYVLTTKAERNSEDRLEVPAPVTEDMFKLFRQLADTGMIKDRYSFPVEGTDLVFEVDMFLDTSKAEADHTPYHQWAKIDLELKDFNGEIPELPIKVEEVIPGDTTDPEQRAKITELYETVFLTKNNFTADAVAVEGFKDWVKDLFADGLTEKDISKVRATVDVMGDVKKMDSFPTFRKGQSGDVVRFMLRNNNISRDLPEHIRGDVANLKILNGIVADVTDSLKKIKDDYGPEEVMRALSSIRTSTVIRLDGTKWLGNFVVTFRKEHATGWVNRERDDLVAPPDFYAGRGIGGLIVGAIFYYFDNKQYGENIKTINQINTGIDIEDFKKASLASREQYDQLVTNLQALLRENNRLKGHQVEEVRHTLRFARNLAGMAVYVSKVYKTFYTFATNNG